jgi:N-acyl amino acid synthase of PEP-CTERM/exosortase system
VTADLGARIASLRQDFHVGFARTPQDFEELHQLRYDVFCAQRGILPGQEGTESDPYDATSRHVVLRRVGGELVGTVRLVLGVHEGQRQRFPMQRVCDPEILARIPLETTGEISRFCLSRDRRETGEHADAVLRLGLMKGILNASNEARLTHWCAAMEKGLLRLLQLAAIRFEPVGPPIEYFGIRQPAVANIAEVLARGKRERRMIWEYVTGYDSGAQVFVAERPLLGAQLAGDMRTHADREMLRRQSAVARLVELALSSEDLDETLADACRLVGEALGTHDATILERQGDLLLVRASSGQTAAGNQTLARVSDDTAEALALKTGEPIISADIDLETRFRNPPHLRANGFRAVANVVIIDNCGGSSFGILQVFSRSPRDFNDKDVEFLRHYAALIAAAVERLLGLEAMRRGAARLGLALEAGKQFAPDSDAAGGAIDDAPKSTQIGGAANPTPSIVPVPARSGPLRVLVVDDSAINRDITSAFLRSAGHEVVVAEGGAEAAQFAAAGVFDVVLMDVRMPGVDGLEATSRIRADNSVHGRVPILGLSAHAFAEQIEECRLAGMDGHLAKPFSPEMLLDAVAITAADTDRLAGMHAQTGAGPVKAGTADAFSTAVIRVSIDTDRPILNHATFARTAAFLAPHTLESHLRTLVERSESLLCGLSTIGAHPAGTIALGTASHMLAGGAGMLGFERLAALAGRFEHAVKSNADTLTLVPGLTAAIEASLREMHQRAAFGADGVFMSSVLQPAPRPFRCFGRTPEVAPCSSETGGG